MIQLSKGPSKIVVGDKVRSSYHINGDVFALVFKLKEFGISHTYFEDMGQGASIEIQPAHFMGLYEFLVNQDIPFEETKEITARVKKSKQVFELPKKDPVVFPKFKLNPLPEQMEALYDYFKRGNTLLSDIMGSGKTATSIFLAEMLNAYFEFNHVLIINGVSSNRLGWLTEIDKFSYRTGKVLGSRVISKGKNQGKVDLRGTAEKIHDLSNATDDFYLITNIESLRQPKFVEEVQKKVESGDIGMVIVDEIHMANNSSSLQGTALQKIRPPFRFGLSGTPFKSPEDIFGTESWLGYTYSSKDSYYNNFGEFKINYKGGKSARYSPDYVFTQPQKFKQNIERYMLRRTGILKSLPSIRFKKVYAELGKEQRAKYEEIVEATVEPLSAITSLEDLEAQEEKAKESVYLPARQIVAHPHTFGVEQDAKLDKLIDLLDRIIYEEKIAIVFAHFIPTVERYAQVLSKRYPGRGAYATEKEDTEQVVAEFKKGDYSFIVGSARKLGTAHNLQKADYVIFADRPETWKTYEQNYMRAWRQGRKDPVQVITIISPDTWDDRISFNLQEQKAISDVILGKSMNDKDSI